MCPWLDRPSQRRLHRTHAISKRSWSIIAPCVSSLHKENVSSVVFYVHLTYLVSCSLLTQTMNPVDSQSAVNKQDQSLSKSPQATFSHLLRTLSSSDNVLLPPLSEASCTSPPLTPMTEMENPASQQPLMHVVGAPSSSRVRINPIAINTTFADLLAETTSSALHGNESRENALQLVYIPATGAPCPCREHCQVVAYV